MEKRSIRHALAVAAAAIVAAVLVAAVVHGLLDWGISFYLRDWEF